MTGFVSLVGAGPGDPGLLTVRGRRRMEEADLVVHDYLVDRRQLELVRAGAEVLAVGAPHGAGPRLAQADVSQLLVDRARAGQRVVRLKNGDPMLFGRGGEEAAVLHANRVPFEIVPGVTSALAVPAFAGIPVTHRDHASMLTIVTGHLACGESPPTLPSLPWAQLANPAGTLVFLMAMKTLETIVEQLLAHGMDAATPAAMIQQGTTANQRTVTATVGTVVAAVRAARLRSPAVLVIGTVVNLRETVGWAERQPLFGRRVLVTRPREQAGSLLEWLASQGAEAIALPTIAIAPAPDPAALDAAVGRAADYDWIVFTSVNGVRVFFERFAALGGDIRSLSNARIAAIGPETAAAVRQRLLQPAVVPDDYRAEGLLAAFAAEELSGRRVLLPRAAGARAVLPDTLRARGAVVDEVCAYQAVLPPAAAGERLRELLTADALDAVTFTSSSTVRNFATLAGPELLATVIARCRPAIACIGPVTAATARELGLPVDVEPERYTVSALADALRALLCTPTADHLTGTVG